MSSRALHPRCAALVVLLVASSLAAAACSEGQVALPGNTGDVGDMGELGDSSGTSDDIDLDVTTSAPADATVDDTSVTTAPDTTTQVPDTTSDTTPGGCTSGARRCSPFNSNSVQTCSGGAWMDSETCSNGCRDGACLGTAVSGTCSQPVPLSVGQTVIGTTDTLYNPNSWSQECRNRYAQQTGVSVSPTGPESVFELNVTQPMMLRISLDALDPTYFALYLRSDCTTLDSELHSVCGGHSTPGGTFSIESFFGVGKYYVFVDDFGSDGNGTGTFELKVEQILLPECGGQIPVPLDVRSQVNLSDTTATGITSHDWNGPACETGIVQSTSGREKIYVFGLAQPSTVNIAAQPTDPVQSQVALYVRTRCIDRYSQVACGYTAGGDAAALPPNTRLPAGAYYLFVDDFTASIDQPQAYDLTIDVTP